MFLEGRRASKIFTHYFFAIVLPAETRPGLRLIQQKLAAVIPEHVVWLRPEQFHLSLRYLGRCAPGTLDVLGKQIGTSLAPPGPLRIQVSSIEPEPPRGKARRIVARVWESTGDLTWIWRTVGAAVQAAGFQPEGKRFCPHITLARVKPPQRIKPAEMDAALLGDELPEAFATSEISLLRSNVSPHGSEHSRVGVIRLPPGPRPGAASVNW